MSTPYLVSDKKIRPISTLWAVLVTALTVGYMLPWAVAAVRGKSDRGSIFWWNLLTGWTLIGWIWSAVKALDSHNMSIGTR